VPRFGDATVLSASETPQQSTPAQRSTRSNPIFETLRNRPLLHQVWKSMKDNIEQEILPNGQPHHFIAKMNGHLPGPDGNFVAFVENRQNAFEESILVRHKNGYTEQSIPPISHKIWLTSEVDLSLPPEEYLINYVKMVNHLPDNMTHYFWTNSEKLEAHLRQKFVTLGAERIFVSRIDVFAMHPVFGIANTLIQHRKFVLAADIMKMVILERFGGIYSDLGIVFGEIVVQLMRMSDFGVIIVDGHFFQTSFIASPPSADVVTLFLGSIAVPGALDPSYCLLGSDPRALDEVHLFAGLGFTAALILYLEKGARLLILPPQSPHHQWRSEQSWYGAEPKHGNVLVGNTAPTILTPTAFEAAAETWRAASQSHGPNTLLRERLRGLLCLHSYFSELPTCACKTFFYHGSDKAKGWHNYGYIYNYVLRQIRRPINTIVEIGIGTNNLNVPSTMGRTGIPGASLRAWREMFPEAQIVGADVDQGILFKEDGISTYFVDQLRPETIGDLFDQLAGQTIDLVIDDGLHTFEANRNVIEAALPRIAQGGLLIIEDVMLYELPRWETYFAESDLVATVMVIPHVKNSNDNCLIFIEKDR